MKLFFTLVNLFILFETKMAIAQEKQCQPSSQETLIQCIVESSIEVKALKQDISANEYLESASRKWLQPEIQADYIYNDEDKSELEATLFFDISVGGKRSARVAEAQALFEKFKAEYDYAVQTKKLETVLNLYRLSHLRSEIEIQQESIDTFHKIVKQFQSRPTLSPEQRASLMVFKMVISDSQLKLSVLKGDEDKIYQNILSENHLSPEIVKKYLPVKKKIWNQINSSAGADHVAFPKVRSALADLKYAESLQKQENANLWPDLKIGPMFKSEKIAGITESDTGVKVALNLPLSSLYSDKRKYAQQKRISADLRYELTRRSAESEREVLVKRYERTVRDLNNILSLDEVSKKHKQTERQFFQGLISSSVIIELHRQIYELEERRNKSELEALEAYGKILILDNKFSEAHL